MRSISPAVALALVLLLAFPPVPADNDSMKVIVLAENREYSIGSLVELTVLVYDGGVPVDPDSTPEVTVLSAAPRGVSVFKFGNGLFKGNFTIQSSDVVGNLVPVEASATIGRSTESDKTYNKDTDIASIYLAQAAASGLSVRLHVKSVSDNTVRPGARVGLAAEVSSGGSPAQPEGFELSAAYDDPQGGSHSEPVNATSPQPGRFEASYPLPQVSYDLHVTFTARASLANASASSSLSLDFNQFWVVYHNYSKSAAETTFYLYAADTSGRAIEGAKFDLGYWPDGNLTLRKQATPATTDQGGKARFRLEFEAGTRALMLEGTANASGKTQRFSAVIDVSTAAASGRPAGGGFEMAYIGPGELYSPGKPAERRYAAFNNSAPLRNSELYTYIIAYPYSDANPLAFTPVEKLQARPYTTDAQGLLTIPFSPPSYNCTLIFYFKNATAVHPKPSGYFFNHDSNDGQYYSETADVVPVRQSFSGGDVKVQASPPKKPGAPTTVKAALAGAEADLAFATLVIGGFDPAFPGGSPATGWQVWAGLASFLGRTADGFSGNMTVPKFIPSDVKCTAAVFIAGKGSPLPQYGSATVPRASAAPPETDQFPIQYLYLIIVVVAVVGGAAGGLALRRRRARAAAPAAAGKTITCPSCGTPFPVVQGPQPVKIQCPSCGKTGTLPALAAAPAGAPGVAAAPLPAQGAAAAAPAPAGGTKLSIPCPGCGTVFDIVRGPGPTRIQCPSCGKTGMLAGLPAPVAPAPGAAPAQAAPGAPAPFGGQSAMQVQMAAAAPASPMMAQAATDMPRPEPVVQTKTIACPQCKNRFTIEKKEGPQQIKCPHCGKEGTIGRAPAPAAAAPAPQMMPQQQPAYQPQQMPPPQMMPQQQPAYQQQQQPAYQPQQVPAFQPRQQPPAPQMTAQQQPAYQPQPMRQTAPGQMAAAPMGQQMRPQQYAAPPAGQPGAQAPGAGKLITCPACRNRFPVADPRRPIKVRCPSCGKEGTLRT